LSNWSRYKRYGPRYPSYYDNISFCYDDAGPDECIPWSMVKPYFRLYGEENTHCFPLHIPPFPYCLDDYRTTAMTSRTIGGNEWRKEIIFDREDFVLPSLADPNGKMPLHPGIACFIDIIEEE